jgi:hypothetical protein
MALTTDDIRTDYPLPLYNYRVEIGSDAVAFSEVSGLNIAFETITFKESPVASGPLRQTSCRLPLFADDPRRSDTICKEIIIRQSSWNRH